jgi:type III secretory pathway component EscU
MITMALKKNFWFYVGLVLVLALIGWFYVTGNNAGLLAVWNLSWSVFQLFVMVLLLVVACGIVLGVLDYIVKGLKERRAQRQSVNVSETDLSDDRVQ